MSKITNKKRTIYLIILIIIIVNIFGCISGMGIEKSATLMPDEFWIAGDMNPNHNDDWRPGEITMGFKWKLK